MPRLARLVALVDHGVSAGSVRHKNATLWTSCAAVLLVQQILPAGWHAVRPAQALSSAAHTLISPSHEHGHQGRSGPRMRCKRSPLFLLALGSLSYLGFIYPPVCCCTANARLTLDRVVFYKPDVKHRVYFFRTISPCRRTFHFRFPDPCFPIG